MARFAKFRWVPMLLQAYYDAQRQINTKATNSSERLTAGKEVDSNISAPVVAASKPRTQKHANQRLSTHGSKPKPSKLPRSVASKHGSTFRLYQELQAANQKLEELTSMQQQLQHIGSAMDDVNRRIEALHTQQNRNVQDAPDPLPPTPTTPSPLSGPNFPPGHL